MNFDLTHPCKDCPFRSDIPAFLSAGRAREITDGLIRRDGTFVCHKTTVPSEDEDSEGDMMVTPKSQHCAGATIMLERLGRPNQLMRIAERLGMYDRSKLDMNAPVYPGPAAMAAAQPRRGRRT